MFVFYGMYYKLKPSMYVGVFKSLKLSNSSDQFSELNWRVVDVSVVNIFTQKLLSSIL